MRKSRDLHLKDDGGSPMEFDIAAFQQLVQEKGTEVYSASYDGSAPGCSGSAGVSKFAGRFWSYDDNGEFGGPYTTLREALGESHLCFGNVQVCVHVSGMSAAAVAKMIRLEAPTGHAVEINDEEWVVGENGELLPRDSSTQKKRATTRKRKKR